MPTTALYNLGVSDLQLYDTTDQMYNRFANMRQVSCAILEHLSNTTVKIENGKAVLGKRLPISVKDKEIEVVSLGFPMLFAFIEKTRELRSNRIDTLILFATNQEDETHKQRDTIYVAQILQRVLSAESKFFIRTVEIEEIACNPSDYGKMQCFYKNFFEKNPDLKYSMIYVQATAGTPAMSLNLALSVLDERHTLLHIEESVDQKTSTAKCLDYFMQRQLKNYLDLIKKAIDSMNYQGALELVKKSPFKTLLEVQCLLEVLIELRNFNFHSALEKAQMTKEEAIIEQLCILNKSGWNESVYRLVLAIIKKFEENKQYLEATVLFAGLYENLRIALFEMITGVKIKDEKKFTSFNSYIQHDPELSNLFENSNLSYLNNPSKPVLSKILKYLHKHKMGQKQVKISMDMISAILDVDKKIDQESIQDLRNNSIYAHGLGGLKEEGYKRTIESLVKETTELFYQKDQQDILKLVIERIFVMLEKDL